ncbi:hypothetical protein CDD83_3369 [Cordyceps sp. RAO-2017]|nr:hypothetical protein CDD83_3369 [Cordyceps sp. RAO-2017]
MKSILILATFASVALALPLATSTTQEMPQTKQPTSRSLHGSDVHLFKEHNTGKIASIIPKSLRSANRLDAPEMDADSMLSLQTLPPANRPMELQSGRNPA